ncbi:MAG TPA: metallophosphoesterase [Gemmatimonadales bacterium]|nr:metallophosphoesterase [Gemmatimonadales bacterium]
MKMLELGLAVALAATTGRAVAAQPDSIARRPYSFAVLGHIRGEGDGLLNPKLGELLDHLRALHPDFVVLTGDIIWGDLFGGGDGSDHAALPDTVKVKRQWDDVDSALATLHIPVYRVPGNHDISDLGTKRIWWQRYGAVPRVVERYGSRFVLLASAWIPADQDTVRRLITRPARLDSSQTSWLKSELARHGSWDHSFVLMHHLMWWEPNAWWWKEIHPLLRPAGVATVFGGDYGPLKFSRLVRDSVLYVQGSMEGIMKLATLQGIASARVLSAQFDNFLFVQVNGPRVDVQVKILGEWSSPQYEPAFVKAMMPGPPRNDWRKWVKDNATPRKLAALGGLLLAVFFAGWQLGRRARR